MTANRGYKRIVVYYGSSTYDTKQMSALIDSLVQEAQALGIETLPPAEIARLNSQWEERQMAKRGECTYYRPVSAVSAGADGAIMMRYRWPK